MTRILIVAPHPDDEVLGCSSLLARSSVTVVHVTDGIPPWTAAGERAPLEAQRGLECRDAWAGLSSRVERIQLGFGDLTAWRAVDQVVPPLTETIAAARPDEVYLPAYQGGHPDHDASYLAGTLARDQLGAGRGPSWRVYGLYGFDDARRVRFGWLPPRLFGPVEVRGGEPESLRIKAAALRCFPSQIRPDSALDRWLHSPVPERFAPLPATWDRLPSLPSFYDEELEFGRYGASRATVEEAFRRVLAPAVR